MALPCTHAACPGSTKMQLCTLAAAMCTKTLHCPPGSSIQSCAQLFCYCHNEVVHAADLGCAAVLDICAGASGLTAALGSVADLEHVHIVAVLDDFLDSHLSHLAAALLVCHGHGAQHALPRHSIAGASAPYNAAALVPSALHACARCSSVLVPVTACRQIRVLRCCTVLTRPAAHAAWHFSCLQAAPESAPVALITSVSAAAHAQSAASALGADDPFSEAAATLQQALRERGGAPRQRLVVQYLPLHLQPLPGIPGIGFLLHLGDAVRGALEADLQAARCPQQGSAQVCLVARLGSVHRAPDPHSAFCARGHTWLFCELT